MRLGFCTDSHDHLTNLRKAMQEFARRGTDAVIHCGDLVAPFTIDALKLANCPVYAVYGNCDGERRGLKKRFSELPGDSDINEEPYIYEIENIKICVMHHPRWVEAFASTDMVDIVAYGHLHQVDIEHRPPWIINPGEVFGLKTSASIVVLDTDNGEPKLIRLANLPLNE